MWFWRGRTCSAHFDLFLSPRNFFFFLYTYIYTPCCYAGAQSHQIIVKSISRKRAAQSVSLAIIIFAAMKWCACIHRRRFVPDYERETAVGREREKEGAARRWKVFPLMNRIRKRTVQCRCRRSWLNSPRKEFIQRIRRIVRGPIERPV